MLQAAVASRVAGHGVAQQSDWLPGPWYAVQAKSIAIVRHGVMSFRWVAVLLYELGLSIQ